MLHYVPTRWLSAGSAVQRLLKLYPFIVEIFKEDAQNPKTKGGAELYRLFTDTNFQIKLSFLADVLKQINMLNLKLQGKRKTLGDVSRCKGKSEKMAS